MIAAKTLTHDLHPLEEKPPQEFQANGAPTIDTQFIDLCPVCAHSHHESYAGGYDYELQTCANAWRFVVCKDCGHVWLNPRPSVSELSVIYPANYYAYNYETDINWIAVKGKSWLDALKMRSLLKFLSRQPTSYMDIGCGTGRFLKYMERRGVERANNYGLELDTGVVETLAGEGYRVFRERVEDCERIPESSLDLVTMFHVIGHVDDPAVVINRVAGWLSEGGVFAIETPNIDCMSARMFKKTFWGGYHFPRHWNLFSRKGLARLCEAAGLEILATRYQTGHSFWMYSLHHAVRYGKRPFPRVAQRLFDPFQGLLPLLLVFTAFDRVRAFLRQPTGSMLMLARKPVSRRLSEPE